jgi:hypothetical protein
MQSVFSDEMADQQIKNDILALKKSVIDADNRTLRLGEKTESLKDYVQTDLGSRISKIEGRTEVMMWMVGIALPLYMALFIAGGVQLYLLNGRVSGMDRDLAHVTKTLDELNLKSTANNPTDPQNIKQAHDTLAEAAANHRKLSKEVVVDTGKKFLQAGSSQQTTWATAMDFLAYRSFLNADLSHNAASSVLINQVARITVYKLPTTAGTLRHSVIDAPINQAAVYELLGQGLNRGHSVGDAFLVVDGGTAQLDGYDLRHVTLRNMHIIYEGGPVHLEDVTSLTAHSMSRNTRRDKSSRLPL